MSVYVTYHVEEDIPQTSKLASDKRWVYYWDMSGWLDEKAN